MTKVKKLRKSIFTKGFTNLPYKQRDKIVYDLARFEVKKRYDDLKVLKCVRVDYEYNVYTICMLVENINLNCKTILVCSFNTINDYIFFNYVCQLSKYDFE